MIMTLEEYYLVNYSQCNVPYSFLASWQGLAYPSHVIQSVSFALEVLTIFLIMSKTPVQMKTFRYQLLFGYFWCTLINLLACSLATPYVYLKFRGGFGVGLLSWLGVPFKYQAVTGFFALSCATSSYIFLFEGCSSSLQENKFRITRKCFRIVYHSLIFLINSSTFFIFFKSPPDHDSTKLNVLELDPCPTSEFFNSDVFIMSTDQNLIGFYVWFLGPFILLNATGHVLFHAACTIYYLFIAPSKLVSTQTQRLQRLFFIGAVFQTGIPLIFVAMPALIVAVIYSINCACQDIMNLAVLIVELHCIAVSLTILTVYDSYRKAMVQMFFGCYSKSEKELSSSKIYMQFSDLNTSVQVLPNFRANRNNSRPFVNLSH
ncbi:hypothetical protein CRE_09027 [Caenorhabditis remanei]|uniref:Serpentine Receptor, class H n=1 Tax=Caenorhabditis remanei TaxID=31234 RepID=E3LIV5_CAERE|nr:hypothetical protein CRE_09027 [Caenorhabditis remanei]